MSGLELIGVGLVGCCIACCIFAAGFLEGLRHGREQGARRMYRAFSKHRRPVVHSVVNYRFQAKDDELAMLVLVEDSRRYEARR